MSVAQRSRAAAVVAGVATAGALTAGAAPGLAQGDALDNLQGHVKQLLPGSTIGAAANAVVVEPTGRIIYAGLSPVDGTDTVTVIATRPDGTPDPGFNHGQPLMVLRGYRGTANALSFQRDGKLLVGGQVTYEHHVLQFFAARVLRDGTLDKTFGDGGVVTTPIGSAAIAMGIRELPDGDVIEGGSALMGGTAVFAAHRLTSTGANAAYGANGTVTVPVGLRAGANGMAVSADGRPVLVGESNVGGVRAMTAVRLAGDGTLDHSFAGTGMVRVPIGVESVGNAVAVQDDGKVVVAGGGDGDERLTAVRINPDGSLDRGFGHGGIATSTGPGRAVNAVAVQPDGRIVLAGGTSAPAGPLGVERLNPDGTRDTTLGDGGLAQNPLSAVTGINGVALQADGGIVYTGAKAIPPRDPDFLLGRLDASGRAAPFSAESAWTLAGGDPGVALPVKAIRQSPTARFVKVVLTNDNAFPVSGKLVLDRSNGRGPSLGSATFTARASARTGVKVRLTNRIRRTLSRGHDVATRITMSVKAKYGPTLKDDAVVVLERRRFRAPHAKPARKPARRR